MASMAKLGGKSWARDDDTAQKLWDISEESTESIEINLGMQTERLHESPLKANAE